MSQPVQLAEAFAGTGDDALEPHDLLRDEVRQRRETGFDVDDVVRAANASDPDDRRAVLALVDAMEHAERQPGWRYVEPTGLEEIRAEAGERSPADRLDPSAFPDRVHAAWLGRIAGCTLGKPVEQGDDWTVERIEAHLRRTDAYPLTDYVVAAEPEPGGPALRECWPVTTRGNVRGAARDDDIDYTILGLHLLEQHGDRLTTRDVGGAWTSLLPITQTYTAERAAYRNLVEGVLPPRTATRRNPWREWIGAQIRADAFGYVLPGDPWAAALLARRDAVLSHTGNGVFGAMWAAALVSAAFVSQDAEEAVRRSLAVVPTRSRLAEALVHVLALHDGGATWQQALAAIRAAYGGYGWIHTVNNAAVVAAALLWAEGDFTTAVGRVVMSGWDTDSNGATVGSVAGILAGTARLPAHLVDPLEDRTRSALFGFDHSAISDLAARTVRVAETLREA